VTPSVFVAARADTVGGDPLLALATDAVIVELFLASLAIGGALLSRRSIRYTLGFVPSRMPWRDVAVLCAGTLALSHGLDTALAWSGWIEHSVLADLPEQMEGATGARLAVALIALALFPAVAEEMLCRGWIQRSLVARIGPTLGIGAAALVFGALHIDPVHALVATGLGLYLGLVAHWADSIVPTVVCHGVNNAAAVVAAAQLGPNPGNEGTLIVSGMAAMAALAWAGRRARRRRAVPSGE
jgi:membrane protease YdiL (CAAX protease family)